MRFALAVLATAGAVSAFKSPVTPRSANPAHLFERQVADAVICAEVDVSITRDDICSIADLTDTQCNGAVTITNPFPATVDTVLGLVTTLTTPVATLCECATADALTDASTLSFNNYYTGTILGGPNTALIGTVNTLLTTLLSGLTVETLLREGLIADINNTPEGDRCPAPANGQATCSAQCGFTCDEGFISCDGETCTSGSVCPSGTRRRRRAMANDLLCETGLTACAIPGNKYAFECLNTITNVESCGGCIFALPGGKRGEDCTAKPGVLDVACIADKCVASSCTKGFVLNGTECVNPEVGSIVEDAKDLVGGVGRLFVNGAGNVVRRNAKAIIQARQASAELLKAKAARR